LVYIICTQGASTPIKCYGPELIVLPFLYTEREARGNEDVLQQDRIEMMDWIKRLDSVVIGTGLGRDKLIQDYVCRVIQCTQQSDIPTIIDADALWTINTHLDLIQNNHNVILTPNVVEYQRLWAQIFEKEVDKSVEGVMELSNRLGVTVVLKGLHDIITDGVNYIICDDEGGKKRAGGQGDILSGTMGTFAAWLSFAKKYSTFRSPLE